jgi:hypothetical protein
VTGAPPALTGRLQSGLTQGHVTVTVGSTSEVPLPSFKVEWPIMTSKLDFASGLPAPRPAHAPASRPGCALPAAAGPGNPGGGHGAGHWQVQVWQHSRARTPTRLGRPARAFKFERPRAAAY